MEVQGGFIVSIFNYCDSWCEKCPFTSRCRVFADRAEMEARLDPVHTPLVNTPPRPEEAEPEPPAWMRELIEEMNEACKRPMSDEEWERIKPRVPAREVIAWFHFLIGAKVNRSLTVWPDDDDDVKVSDADGSAKVALLGIERSREAWLALVEQGAISPSEADPFIADLVWLGEALERIRPRARAFVRPAFDEPDAVARLLAFERQ